MDELDAYVTAQGINDTNKLTNCLNVTEIATPVVLPIWGILRMFRPFSRVPAWVRHVEASALNWVASGPSSD